MHCPYCDQEHKDGTRFCPTTGQKLTTISFCANCGNEIQQSWKACPICGRLLDSEPDIKAVEFEQRRQRRYVPIALSILVVAFGFAVYMIYRPKSRMLQSPVTNALDAPRTTDLPVSSAGESSTSWLKPLPPLSIVKLNITNVSELASIGRLGRGMPLAIAQSPVGGQIAVATTSGISIIDLNTFKEIMYLDESSQAASVSYSPDGSQLAVGLGDGQIVIYDLVSGNAIKYFPFIASISSFPVYDTSFTDYDVIVVFSSDGQNIIASTGSSFVDGVIEAFDIVSNEKEFSFYGPNGIASLDVDTQSRFIAVCSDQGQITILDATTGDVMQTVSELNGSNCKLKFSPDAGSLAIGLRDKGIYVWSLASKSIMKHISNTQMQSMYIDNIGFGPDGNTIIFNDTNGNIGSINTQTDTLTWLIKAHDKAISTVIFSKDPEMIVSGSADGYVLFLNPADGYTNNKLRLGYDVMGDLGFSPDGSVLAAGHGEIIDLWKIPGGTLQAELMQLAPEGMSGSGLLAFSPNGINLAADSGAGSINLWDIRENNVNIGEFKAGGGIVRAIKFAQGGDILASAFDDPVVALQNTSDHKTIVDFPGSSEPLAVSEDGFLFAFASRKDKTPAVAVYDTQSGQIIWELVGNESVIQNISFNSNGSLLASGDYSDKIIVWNISDAAEVFSVDEIPVRSLAFSPSDPWLLASSGDDGMLHLWDVQNKKMIAAISADNCNQTCLTSLVFSPDGTLIATGSLDGSMRLWGVSR